MPTFQFSFIEEDEAPKPGKTPKPRPARATRSTRPEPAAGFGAEPEPYVAPPLTPAQQASQDAERAWSQAHEEMCMYTRYGQVPPGVALEVERLFQVARELAHATFS